MDIAGLMEAINGIGDIVVGLYAIHVTVSVGILALFGTLRLRGSKIPLSLMIFGSIGYGGFAYAQYEAFMFLNRKADALLTIYRETNTDYREAVAAAMNGSGSEVVQYYEILASSYNTPFFNFTILGGSTTIVIAIWVFNMISVDAER